jgi:flavodoxin I
MSKIGIFYGSTEGNTERVAGKIQALLGTEVTDLINVASASADDFAQYDHVILASSTWEMGELQEDWDTFIDELDDVAWEGKQVAFVGLGDAIGYPDTFIDAIGIIYDKIKGKGWTLVGEWPTDGYDYEDSKALIDGKFLGLAIDEDNQANLTDKRIAAWVNIVKPAFEALQKEEA